MLLLACDTNCLDNVRFYEEDGALGIPMRLAQHTLPHPRSDDARIDLMLGQTDLVLQGSGVRPEKACQNQIVDNLHHH